MRWIIMFLLSTGITTYEISNANPSEVIHINDIGVARTLCRYHRINYIISFEGIKKMRDHLSESIQLLEEICKTAKFNHVCTYTLKEIRALSIKLDTKGKFLRSIASIKRSRRDLYEIKTIMQKVIYLADSSYNDLKRSLDEMQSISNSIVKAQNKLQDHLDYVNFDTLAQLTSLSIQSSIDIFDSIMEVFLNKNYKKLLNIITIDMLKENLSEIRKTARNESCDISVEPSMFDHLEFMRIVEIRPERTKTELIIGVDIPTSYSSVFEIKNAIPLPFEFQSNTYEVQPVHDYYLIKNQLLRLYAIPMSREEFRECIQLFDHRFCSPNQIMEITENIQEKSIFLPNYNKCNSQFMNEILREGKYCNIKKVSHYNRIVSLSANSFFIYVVTPTSLHITCDGKDIVNEIKSSVIIKNLESACSLSINQASVPEHREKISENEKTLNSFESFPVKKTNLIQKEYKNYNMKPSRDLQNDFTDLKEEMAIEMHTNSTTPKPRVEESTPYFGLVLVILFYAVLLILFLGFQIVRQILRKYNMRPTREFIALQRQRLRERLSPVDATNV